MIILWQKLQPENLPEAPKMPILLPLIDNSTNNPYLRKHGTDTKPMDQPKVDRMLRLMQLLSSNIDYSVDDLMKELDISRRTVYRYIDTFKEAGFAVQNTHGNVWRLATLKNKYGDLSKVVYFSEEEACIMNGLLESLDNTNALKQTLRRKLVAVYDFDAVGDYVANEAISENMDAISDAIREKKTVLLKDYASSHAGKTKSYKVEPYQVNTNHIDLWAYDVKDGINKRFKTARIGRVEILSDEPWQHEEAHASLELDDFRIHGEKPVHVRLRLDMVARNLLLEEYPLAEKNLSAEGDETWIYEADCNGMKGVGRFVLGLPDRIEVLEGEEVKGYLKEKAGYILNDKAL